MGMKVLADNIVKRLNKTLIVAILTLSGKAKAYIADRCDWLDCEAMATGTDEGSGLKSLKYYKVYTFYTPKDMI